MAAYLRLIGMFAAFVAGYFLPEAATLSFLIRYLIIFMMTVVFLQLKLKNFRFYKSQWYVFAANVAIGLVSWGLFKMADNDPVAQAAFFTGITPTATAAAVVTSLLGGSAAYVIGAFLITNVGMSILLIGLVPLVSGNPAPSVFLKVFGDLMILLVVPFLIAWPIRKFYRGIDSLCSFLKKAVFWIWVFTVFLIVANSSAFLHLHPEIPQTTIFTIGLVSLVICAVNFALGVKLGGWKFGLEAGQSLGQKNTTLTLFLAILYGDPLAALGPGFYVLWHNGYNAWQLFRRSMHVKKRTGRNRV